jgi:hypothetical protein
MMKPPPNKSACLVIEILLLFFTNTLAHFAASVAQAPSNSNARELELSSTKIVQESIRAIVFDVDIPSFHFAEQLRV